MGFGSGGFGSSPFGSGVSGAGSSSYDVLSAEAVTKDCILVSFSAELVVNSAYKTVSNYTVTDLTANRTMEVKSVLVPSDFVSDKVYLKTGIMTPGNEYRVQVSTLISRSGNPALNDTVYFEYYWTKTDAMLSSMPSVYDKSFESTVRAFLTAVSSSDHKIGG